MNILYYFLERNIIEEECYSAQFEEIQKVSKTELAEILMNARDAIVVINFNKQATADSIHKNLMESNGRYAFPKP